MGAAEGLGIEVAQIASSIVFGLPPAEDDGEPLALLVVTSGAHRVDTRRVAELLGVPKLLRADADFVRRWSGFAIGGVAPVAWAEGPAVTLVDEQLAPFDAVWATCGVAAPMCATNEATLMIELDWPLALADSSIAGMAYLQPSITPRTLMSIVR